MVKGAWSFDAVAFMTRSWKYVRAPLKTLRSWWCFCLSRWMSGFESAVSAPVAQSGTLLHLAFTDSFELVADRLNLRWQGLAFLADSRGQDRPFKAVFGAALGQRRLVYSQDGGHTWSLLWQLPNENPNQKIARLHVGRTRLFVQTRDPVALFVVSHGGDQWQCVSAGYRHWHGSQGMDESPDGVVMYSEYQAGEEKEAPMLHVWRSQPPYYDWEPVLSLTSGVFPQGDIRHFHTCVADPQQPGVWYVSSGDTLSHNGIWRTSDNGDSWQRLAIVAPGASQHGIESPDRLARFTALAVREPSLLWATDDGLGIGRSAVVRCELNEAGDRACLQVAGLLGANYARNLMALPNGYLVISESKNDPKHVDFWHLGERGNVLGQCRLPSQTQTISPVTTSLGSAAFVDGVAFIPGAEAITGTKGGLIRLSIFPLTGQ